MNLQRAYDLIAPSEGSTTFMYRDNAAAGNVTIGVGCLLHDLDAALALPFVGDSEGRPATPSQMTAAFEAVMALPPGLKASAYRLANGPVYLPQSAVMELFTKRCVTFLTQLNKYFPESTDWPEPALLATMDWIYNCGVGALMSTVHLKAALAGQDWNTAADACHRAASSDRRNAQCRDLYLAALVPA